MIVIHLLSIVGDVNVTGDCCTVKVMEFSKLDSKLVFDFFIIETANIRYFLYFN